MKFKEVATSNASTEAKVAALALLLDKELIKLADTVLNVKKLEGPKGEQGIQGPKGEQGDRGFDGTNGKDGADGKDGKDGAKGKQGVGVADAKIDFDGSLVITLTDGTEINAGDVVPLDTAEKIRVIGNGGGTSQSVLDAIEAIQATIATYGTMATQNANAVAITGGSINGTTVGSTTPAAGTFTTLTATGQTSLGGAAGGESLRVTPVASAVNWVEVLGDSSVYPSIKSAGAGSTLELRLSSKGGGSLGFLTNNLAQRQMQVSHTASAVNYVQVTGSATNNNVELSSQGSDASVSMNYTAKNAGGHNFRQGGGTNFRVAYSETAPVNYPSASGGVSGNAARLYATGSDTNIALALLGKGTGAIDLAAGSRGVNISNGGTVTALTVTAAGSAYTTIPTPAITAPTTAGGVQATATATALALNRTIISGGTGYTVNDVVTVVGGTFTTAAQFTVSAVSGGVVTTLTALQGGTYSVLPTGTLTTTGGTGTGLTLTIDTWGVRGLSITNAGSGYVEQPTVSFSGGGGSGAAAYATVGSGTVVKSIGSTMDFYTANAGVGFRIADSLGTGVNYWQTGAGYTSPFLWARGSTNTNGNITSNGTGNISIYTNGGAQQQLNVAHTASAVNYVQVTGAATGGRAVISAQGSDTNTGLSFTAKGNARIAAFFNNNATSSFHFSVGVGGSTSSVNYLDASGAVAGSAPSLSSQGSDTNIDLTLTPKGTGNVRFGTYTASMALTVQGYIEIKDSGGTVRKLAVIA